MPEQVKPDKHLRRSAERRVTEPTDESHHQAPTRTYETTPTVGSSRILTIRNPDILDTSHSSPLPAQHRSRSQRSSSSSGTVKLASNTAGKAPERRSPSPSSDNDDYGEVIAPRLDLAALSQLPPRLQESMLALHREHGLRAARQQERLPLPTPQRTTPLGSHPPTDDERAYAREMTQRYGVTAPPPSRLRTGPRVNRTIAPFMEQGRRGLTVTEPVPPSTGGRMLKKSKSRFSLGSTRPKVAEKLASAKKWVRGVFMGKEGGEGGEAEEQGGVEGGDGGGDGEEEEEEEEEEERHQMTSRGRLERYF